MWLMIKAELLQWTEQCNQTESQSVLTLVRRARAAVEESVIRGVMTELQATHEVIGELTLTGDGAFLECLFGAGGEAICVIEEFRARRYGEDFSVLITCHARQ